MNGLLATEEVTEVSTMLSPEVLGVVGVFIIVIVIMVLGKKSTTTVDGDEPQSRSSESTGSNKQGKSQKYHQGLQKSRGFMAGAMERLFGSGVDEDALEELEETLLMADVGMQTTIQIVEQVRKSAAQNKEADLRAVLQRELLATMDEDVPLRVEGVGPYVIMMVGVNGSGKTTTIGKLAHRFVQEGKSVMVAAGDTFRAGAIEQLQVWAERVGAEFISSEPGADPASVMFNALDAAKARNVDVLLCDTAGRLQAHGALMAELGKVMKVMKKNPRCPSRMFIGTGLYNRSKCLVSSQRFYRGDTVDWGCFNQT